MDLIADSNEKDNGPERKMQNTRDKRVKHSASRGQTLECFVSRARVFLLENLSL